ncbi:MAG TPA: Ig-like domain-containing protein [Verrucomicrobiae bacterium]|nr:Ig-like domain-containing protein [Verrucomicrobiae bacterium]
MKQPEVQPLVGKRSFGVLGLLLAVLLSATLQGAQGVTLAWDPSPGPAVVGYKIHYGETSGAYASVYDAGNATNATLAGLLAGHTYYLVVCAYNASALESDPSNEVQYTVPTPANNPPVANNSSVQGNEDQTMSVLLTGSDPEGNSLTYAIVAPPTYGTLSGTAPNLTYRPQTNYYGPDSFTFRVNDGATNSGPATVSLTVTPVNDPPAAANGSATTMEDTSAAVLLSGSDVEGGALTYSIVASPIYGTLTGTAPNLTYRPQTNYSGADSFTFRVNDGTANSAPAAVSITVTAVNDPPLAMTQSVTTAENTAVAVALAGSDVEGSPLTYAVVASPTHGALTGTTPNLTYTPQANYNGPDSFTFRVNDGTTNSGTATVSITVTAVNSVPVANSASATASEDTGVAILLSGSDSDGDPLAYAVVDGPIRGSLSGTPPNLSYRPNTNYNGADSFTFRVNDGSTNSAMATVSITVAAVNDVPLAAGNSVTTPENTLAAITVTGSDVDGDGLTYAVVASPLHGTLTGAPPNLTYVPQTNYSGPDGFTFKVNDGTVDSAEATISIVVTSVNSPPVAVNGSVTTAEDTVADLVLSGSDADGGVLTYSIVSAPAQGSLSGTPPNLSYRPNTNYSGADSFTFRVNDGTTDSGVATVSITVTPVNDPPIATGTSATSAEDTSVNVVLGGSDTEGAPLTYVVVAPPTQGSLSGSAPNLTYRPRTNYSGADSFTFKVNDGTADSATATVSITLTAVNDRPVAANGAVTTPPNTPVSVLLSATDADGNTLTYTVVTQPARGALSGQAPNLVYTPQTNYSGLDSFRFRVNDGAMNSTQATVSVTVTNLNTAPTISAIADQVTTQNVATAAIPFVVGDAQSASGNLTLSGVSSNPGLVPDANIVFGGADAARTVTVTPVLDQTGSATITVTVSDGNLTSSQAFVVTVNAGGGGIVTAPNITVSSITVDPIGFATITWAATPGNTYRVFYKTDLSDPTWQALGADVVASGATAVKQDYVTGNRFYGVAQLP